MSMRTFSTLRLKPANRLTIGRQLQDGGCDGMTVVDEHLRVRRIDWLCVIDASIMPHLTSGNTDSPTMMIGLNGGATIKADTAPPSQKY